MRLRIVFLPDDWMRLPAGIMPFGVAGVAALHRLVGLQQTEVVVREAEEQLITQRTQRIAKVAKKDEWRLFAGSSRCRFSEPHPHPVPPLEGEGT
jgi:hypothetical protein